MATGLTDQPGRRPARTVVGTVEPLLDSPRLRVALLALSTGLLLLVGVSRPDAAQPDLGPRGWAPGSLLPLTLGPAAVSVVLVVAYLVGAAAVGLGLRQRTGPLRSWGVPGLLGGLALLTAPFGSADHVNYLAYGRILVQGGDPWLVSPSTWAGGTDPVVSRVEAPWTEEPSVYGPAGTLLHAVSAWGGGDVLRQGVWVWQVLVVLAWLAVRALLRATLADRGRVDVVWTLNPLVLGVGVLGAHIDVVAAALAVAAVTVVARRPGAGGALAGGAVGGLALSTKVTYGIVLVALAGALWWAGRRATDDAGPAPAAPPWSRWGALVGGAALTAVPLHWWAGSHVFDQLERSRQAVSLATPWRLVLEAVTPVLGSAMTRTLVATGAAVLAVVLAVLLLRLSAPGPGRAAGDDPRSSALGPTALWLTAGLALAYSLAAAYTLPWYDVLVWAALPAVLPGVVDLVALARLGVLACAYVPGRVLGMTPTVEAVTLGYRRHVAPWLVLVLWAAVIAIGVRRGSRPSPAPPRAGSPHTPTR